MKRKGFLKKIIGALCAGALISMPVTVSAAEKEDVVGEWTGSWASVTFNEDGTAEDDYNIREYHMEAGSFTGKVANDGSGSPAFITVDYDLWRGEIINEVPQNEYADAVIYKIIGSGRMEAFNVAKASGNDYWDILYHDIITNNLDTGSSDSASAAPVSSGRGCNHSYEWSVTTDPTETTDGESSYICTLCGDIKARQPVSAYVVI